MGSTSFSNNNLTQVAPFPVPSYSDDHTASAWEGIQQISLNPNISSMSRFFNVFTFARGAILAFEENNIEEPSGKRGTLIFTGVTAMHFLLVSLAHELCCRAWQKENIHVAHLRLYHFILSRFDSNGARRV